MEPPTMEFPEAFPASLRERMAKVGVVPGRDDLRELIFAKLRGAAEELGVNADVPADESCRRVVEIGAEIHELTAALGELEATYSSLGARSDG